MTSRTDIVYIFWTCRDIIEAKNCIHALLHQRLIACASIFPEVVSIYRWEGNIEESREVKVIFKTVATHFHAIQHYIQTHCSYEVPEILQVDIAQGNPSYLSWVVEETAQPKEGNCCKIPTVEVLIKNNIHHYYISKMFCFLQRFPEKNRIDREKK